MTIYTDLNESSVYNDLGDPTEDLASVTEGCCCGSETGGLDELYGTPWPDSPEAPVFDDGVDAYSGYDTTPAPVEASAVMPAGQPGGYEVPSAPVDASAVMPAGQPGGYEVPVVADLDGPVDWPTSGSDVEHLYPSVGTIGGDQLGAMTITPSPDAVPTFDRPLNTIGGGDPYGAITITMGADTPAVSATSATIGQAQPSNLDLLGSLYGMAGEKGDIFAQATLLKTIAATQAVTAPYTAPLD